MTRVTVRRPATECTGPAGGQRDIPPTLVRHSAVAAATAMLFLLFWISRPQWDVEMRLWRAVGDTAAALLMTALAMGPAARLSTRAGRVLPWRRQVGIWTALLASVHAFLVFNGWALWSVSRLLGYEFVPQLGREARMEPGFGLANLVGAVALLWLLVLLATSSDRALRYLGPASWKWVHNGAQVAFYLVLLHAGYFLFLHYTESFHRAVPPPDWFRFPFLLLGLAVLTLQWAAFAHAVRRRRRRSAPDTD